MRLAQHWSAGRKRAVGLAALSIVLGMFYCVSRGPRAFDRATTHARLLWSSGRTPWRPPGCTRVPFPSTRLCSGPVSSDGPPDLAATLELVAHKGTVEPDGHDQIAGRACDRWSARGRGLLASMSDERLKVCIEPTTNLPLELSINQRQWLFSEWNAPRTIELPANTSAISTASSPSPP
jgi:hypothetical protein